MFRRGCLRCVRLIIRALRIELIDLGKIVVVAKFERTCTSESMRNDLGAFEIQFNIIKFNTYFYINNNLPSF